jgi:hypothetical protein
LAAARKLSDPYALNLRQLVQRLPEIALEKTTL